MWWLLFVALAVAAAQAALLGTWCLTRVAYERSFGAAWAYEGEEVTLREVLTNRKLLPVPWLRAESRISQHLRFHKQSRPEIVDEREIQEGQYHRSAFFLPPMVRVTRTHRVMCAKRGFYDIGSVALTAGDLLGMTQRSRQSEAPCQLTVYPRPLEMNELPLPSSRFLGELLVKRFIMPDPYLVGGIRPMMPGDPLRDIHWGATAHSGQLQVKLREFTADPRLLVILNVQMMEEQWAELMDYEQGVIEHGLRIAATLCARALAAGVEAGFASNGYLTGEPGAPVFLPALRGPGALDALLSAMARLVIHRERTFPTFLSELRGISGMDILILSAYDSDMIRQQMAALQGQGNSVALQILEGEGVIAA